LAFSRNMLWLREVISANSPQVSRPAHRYTVGQAVIHTRQARAHDLGKDHRVHDDHRQRVEHGPQRAEQRIAITRLKPA
jgi:hypothetical protein